MEKIFNYPDGTFGVVSNEEVKEGDRFQNGYNKVTKEFIFLTVDKVLEQRPERGEHLHPDNVKQWARVSTLNQ